MVYVPMSAPGAPLPAVRGASIGNRSAIAAARTTEHDSLPSSYGLNVSTLDNAAGTDGAGPDLPAAALPAEVAADAAAAG